jgi:2-oxoglutarate ferredoxin oxidoreductase subunit alpha
VEESEARHETYLTDDAEVIIVAYGAAARVSKNAVDQMRADGVKVGLVRPVTLWPFPKKTLLELSKKAKAFVVAELSMGQMIEDVELAIKCSRPVLLCSRTGGVVMQPQEVIGKVGEALKLV